ncbi:MAG: DUF1840 domain-containing protein [Gammaproteobacteria bacterium]
MLITFRSTKSGKLVMFGDVAIDLLKKMGMSGHPLGAVKAAEIPVAVQRLRKALDSSGDGEPVPSGGGDEDDDQAVGLRQRAFPLIEFLERSAAGDADVMWEHN